MASTLGLLLSCSVLLLVLFLPIVHAELNTESSQEMPLEDQQLYFNARNDDTTTFYGAANGSGTMGEACGYADINQQGYGLQRAAALLNNLQRPRKALSQWYPVENRSPANDL